MSKLQFICRRSRVIADLYVVLPPRPHRTRVSKGLFNPGVLLEPRGSAARDLPRPRAAAVLPDVEWGARIKEAGRLEQGSSYRSIRSSVERLEIRSTA